MSKIMIIDEKMNSVVIEVSPQSLRAIGVKPEDIKKHKSRRQLVIDIDRFLQNIPK